MTGSRKGSRLVLTMGLLVGLALDGTTAAATETITVDSLADPVPTATDGACTLREAITNANADGDATGGDCIAGSGTDTIAFSARGTVWLSASLPEITGTLTIDGDEGVILSGKEMVRVLQIGAGARVFLQELTIERGRAPVGGGILNRGQLLRLIDSTVRLNRAEQGAGIFAVGGEVHLLGSTLSGNVASNSGGGLHATSSVQMWDSEVAGNEATTGSGGGMLIDGPTSFQGSVFARNSAANLGGALAKPRSSATGIDDTSFTDNAAGVSGGALYSGGGAYLLRRNVFSDNRAGVSGGAFWFGPSGAMGNEDSTFSGNSAGLYGGAMYGSYLASSNNTFVGNSAGVSGGAIHSVSGYLSVVRSTLVDNRAEAQGGAIFQTGSPNPVGSYFGVGMNTIARNSAAAGGGIAIAPPLTTPVWVSFSVLSENAGGNCSGVTLTPPAGWNLEYTPGGANTCGFTNNSISGDPKLGPLQNNGGATRTLALGPGSAAMDAFVCGTSGDDPRDQRGLSRPQGARCDIGAVEMQQLSIENAEATESDAALVFPVSLSSPALVPVTVTFTTMDGSATAGEDYEPTSGTVTIAPQESSTVITVPLIGDAAEEPEETFTVELWSPVGAAVAGGGAANGTIVDDD